MDEKNVDTVLRFFKVLEAVRKPWEDEWEEMLTYLMPSKADFTWTKNDKKKRKDKTVYDSTAMLGVSTIAHGLQGYLTPESGNWFRLQTPIKGLETEHEVRRFLQDTEDALYHELSRSNFYHALAEAYPLSVGPGTATVYVEDAAEREAISYTTMHPKEIYIHENRYGEVDTHVRKFPMTIENLIDQFGDKVPKDVRLRAEDNPYEELTVVRAVFPRRTREYGKIDNLNKPFASISILEDTNDLLSVSGFDENPYTTHRWSVNPGEVYGRGWGYLIMTDTLRLNALAKVELTYAHLGIKPPMWYPAHMTGRLNLDPGGLNPYNNPSEVIQKIDMVGNFPIAQNREMQLKESIRDGLMLDFFVSLQQLQGKNMTATQVLEMQGEKAAILSSITNRIYTELLSPLLVKTWRIAHRAGRMPEIPEALLSRGVTGLKIDFVGPLAQIQKRYHAFQGVTQSMEQITAYAKMFPQMLQIIDADELGRHLLNEGGFPQKAMRDRRKVEKMREQEAKAMEEQKQLAQMETMGKAAPGLNQPVKPGSPLAAMGQTMGGGGA